MKNNIRTLTVFIGLASMILIFNNCDKVAFEGPQPTNQRNIGDELSKNLPDARKENILEGKGQAISTPASSKKDFTFEPKKLKELLEMSLNHVLDGGTKEDLVSFLDQKQLGVSIFKAPSVAGLEDVYSIRTRKSFGNLKYIQAIYIRNPDGTEMLRRIAFDIPVGPTSFKDALTLVEKSFPHLGDPKKDPNYNYSVTYDIGDYDLWINYNFWEDIMDDPVNPYTPEDEGSVTISLEYDVHDAHDHDHNHDYDEVE